MNFGWNCICNGGGTVDHYNIVQNCTTQLKKHFPAKGCVVFSENIKLEVSQNKKATFIGCNGDLLPT